MINLVIVDDEVNQIKLIRDCIESYFPQIRILGTANSVPEAETLIRNTKPDLVFSDIDMPPYSGFDLLKRFEKIDFSVVFITGFDKYAVRAFEVAAVDYLVKPVTPEFLQRAIKKFEVEAERKKSAELLQVLLHNHTIHQKDEMHIALPKFSGFDVIKLRQVIHIRGEGNYSRFFLSDNTERLVTKQLGVYEKALIDFDFYRVHKSNMVNLQHVKSVSHNNGGEVVMSNGSVIEIARGRKEDFLLKLKPF
ncbi:MAG: response regulator transcription factor [Bacteroidetes bacterium]|nr:response regulator transcription factor [Bacteroidota bacterium]